MTQAQVVQKWALLWRTIIRSSISDTAYPYCLYIRSLDLRNLADLLDDPSFRDYAMQMFFIDKMSRFLKFQKSQEVTTECAIAKISHLRLDIIKILELVGESVTTFIYKVATKSRATVAVEDLSGDIRADALIKWTSRLSKLKSITLWDGSVLNQETAKVIANGCFEFDDLTFYTCLNPKVDQELALFFRTLRPNSLRSFTALRANAVGSETFCSLCHHASSLRYLGLNGLKSDAIKKLSLLQDCKSIVSLKIEDSDGIIDLWESEKEVFEGIVKWLCGCRGLRELIIENLISAPEILTAVCLSNFVRLQRLQVIWYPLVNSHHFHRALAKQSSLEFLTLNATSEGAGRDDIDLLVSSISHLTKLKHLNILSTSDYFSTPAIVRLVSRLSKLEDLTFGGYDVTDDLWDAMANLPYLRALSIHAISSFSFEGILSYVDALHDTNEGLLLSVMSQSPDKPISEGEQSIIRQSLAANVCGIFDFTLYREPDSDIDFSD